MLGIKMSRYRLGIDIGGTFTDFSLVDAISGEVRVEKMLTSSSAPEKTVIQGVDLLSETIPNMLTEAKEVIHATTLITNVILERKGSKTGLLTTEGFTDILEIAREVRYDIFDMFIRLPEPMVPRNLRLGAEERILASGMVLNPLNEASVRKAAEIFREADVEAVAVAFLHSYQNSSNEIRAGEILKSELPNVILSLSHEVHPEPKEYERTSTTVIDAYVKGIAEGYLDQLSEGLKSRGYRNRLFVMLSNGGTATVETAKSVPVQIVESGPAAGVEAASYFGRLMNIDPMLSFDMGGTTAKLCIIENGRAARTRTYEVDRVHRFKMGSGLPAAVPVYDLLEIGAGGGSIARVNDLGLMQVGPDSSGSDPGPASYGLNGQEPTVTDADLLLGYLNPDYFLGGQMRLDRDAAERAIRNTLSEKTGLTPIEAAAGVHEIVNENMASAARVYVAEKGQAPSKLSLVAFGGAGPVHALGLARKLGCPKVIVPPFSGVMSSLGLLAAPVAFERSRTIRQILRNVDLTKIHEFYRELEQEARSLMPEGSELLVRRTVDLRYSGQDYPLEIDIEEPTVNEKLKTDWEGSFEAEYNELYGKVDDENPIELASIRVYVSQPMPHLDIAKPTATTDAEPKAVRDVYVSSETGTATVPVYERTDLCIGQLIMGPAIVEERESTTVIGDGDKLTVNNRGCLEIDLAKSSTNTKESDDQSINSYIGES
ncbi:MAG: methylhydantoinase [Rhodospirillaceae bacterium]|nr:methylhydantoinase [Rhodospirillaceae bacterium]|tara:strand:- start:1443 stop:3584 length:2142 start_codon:yes stop_codon:yes gene_type:complete